MAFRIVPIVEGHGEIEAIPLLLRRIIAQLDPHVPIEIGRPVRQPRGRLLTEGGIERAVQFAAIDMGATGAVFIILDSEGDCQSLRLYFCRAPRMPGQTSESLLSSLITNSRRGSSRQHRSCGLSPAPG